MHTKAISPTQNRRRGIFEKSKQNQSRWLCCEALGLEGADYARGYIQNWLYQGIGYNADAIPEKSARKILRAADRILRSGRSDISVDQPSY